jgi:hypothetical protein
MASRAEIAAATAARERVAARVATGRNPHPAPEVTAALHMSEDGGHPSEIMPMREGPGEQRHLVSGWTVTSRATDVDPVAGLNLVGMHVKGGAGGEGGG